MKVLVDGVLAPMQAGGELALPRGVDGVFETLRVNAGVPEYWDEHWRRFSQGCAWYRLEFPLGSEPLRALAASFVAENRIRTGVLRYAAWREDGRTAWRMEATHPRPTMNKESFRLTLGPVLPPAGPERRFKHLRRDLWLEARLAARAAGFDEAILRDAQDRVVETCGGNIFLELGGELRTPGPGSGALPGTMQRKVIEAARLAGITVREEDCYVPELAEAREILVSNSLIGLLPAHEYDGRALAAGGVMLQRLRRALSSPKHG